MITVESILDAIADQFEVNTALQTWITTNGGGNPLTIFIGEDAINPPAESDAPFVVLAPGMRSYDLGTGADAREPSIEMDWGIKATAGEPTITGNRKTYTSILLADQLGQLLVAAVKVAIRSDRVQSANYSLDPVMRWPLVEGGCSITFRWETGTNAEPAVTD